MMGQVDFCSYDNTEDQKKKKISLAELLQRKSLTSD